MDEITFHDVTVVCTTADCVNEGVEITLRVPTDSTNVICGPCGVATE